MPLAFAPRTVTVGAKTKIKLRPHLGEFDQAALFQRELRYEPHAFAWLERYAAQRYDAVVEIGANVGVYSVFFAALREHEANCRLRHVYAFEPSRKAYGRLLANLESNDAYIVEPFAVAISDATEFAVFYEPEDHLTNGSMQREFAQIFSGTVQQSTVIALASSTLVQLFAGHERVLLKIDAEGLEPKIIAAMAPVLDRYRPDLLIEVLDGGDDQLRSIECLANYLCFHLTDEGLVQRSQLAAHSAHRDWLLTMLPHDLKELKS